jgi:hypothetical protein
MSKYDIEGLNLRHQNWFSSISNSTSISISNWVSLVDINAFPFDLEVCFFDIEHDRTRFELVIEEKSSTSKFLRHHKQRLCTGQQGGLCVLTEEHQHFPLPWFVSKAEARRKLPDVVLGFKQAELLQHTCTAF